MHYMLDDDGRVFAGVLNVRNVDAVYNPEQRNDEYVECWTIKSFMTDRRELATLLSETLDEHCQHAHDCCGHFYRYVSTSSLRHVKRHEWQVLVSYQQNI